ncbi:MAG: RHS repeat-associated core domain-containing protein, partial [Candidatus Entotheonellia bacterium]
MKTMRYPQDVDGGRKELRPQYNRAGALERVELDGTTYVDHIAYSAKGQRSLIALGNGVMTRYAYDPQTFRLARMRTERYEKPAGTALIYHLTAPNQPLQDFAYAYDLVGNILRIVDRTPGSGVQDNPEAALIADPALAALVAAGNALVRRSTYDPLYRLTGATGRECKDIPRPRPWTDDPRCGANSPNHGTPNQDNAPNLTAVYYEDYAYDPAGNMTSRAHRTNGFAWTRHFGMGGLTPDQWGHVWPSHLGTNDWPDPPGNRLTHVGDDAPTTPQTHVYDANGNLIRETTSRHFEWDHSDQMKAYRTQAGTSEPSSHAHYLYDVSGQRMKKLVRKQGGGVETSVYIDGLFEHHRWKHDSEHIGENNQLHAMDDLQRVAMIRIGDLHPDDRGPAVQYHLGDHVSSNLLINEDGGFINREEYMPYGETSFGSFAGKRYRFTGKERDEESGLFYHGARYYAPWVARWASSDPRGLADGLNLYKYARNNPVSFADATGMQSDEKPFFERVSLTTEIYRSSNEVAQRWQANISFNVFGREMTVTVGGENITSTRSSEIVRERKVSAEPQEDDPSTVGELYGGALVEKYGDRASRWNAFQLWRMGELSTSEYISVIKNIEYELDRPPTIGLPGHAEYTPLQRFEDAKSKFLESPPQIVGGGAGAITGPVGYGLAKLFGASEEGATDWGELAASGGA